MVVGHLHLLYLIESRAQLWADRGEAFQLSARSCFRSLNSSCRLYLSLKFPLLCFKFVFYFLGVVCRRLVPGDLSFKSINLQNRQKGCKPSDPKLTRRQIFLTFDGSCCFNSPNFLLLTFCSIVPISCSAFESLNLYSLICLLASPTEKD